MEKKTAKEKVTMRLDPKVVKSARKIARRDYGHEKFISAVTEDALKRHVANENQSEDFSAILGQTEFALYERISQKIEREMLDTLKVASNRIGNLIGTAAYDVALTSVILETNMKRDPKSKELYEKCRAIAAQRMKRRYDKDGAEEMASLIQENESLKDELAKARLAAKKLEAQPKKQDDNSSEVILNLNDSFQKSEDLRKAYANYHHQLIHFLNDNDTASLLGKRKSFQELLREFAAKNPKPKGM